MAEVHWERYPHTGRTHHARAWLQIQANLGLAPNTIDAYGRALEEYLELCIRSEIVAEAATKEHVSCYVHDLMTRPNPRGEKIAVLDSGVGLANATLHQRLTAIRLWYDYLVEEGIRADNPVGRGRYTSGKIVYGKQERGLLPRHRKLRSGVMQLSTHTFRHLRLTDLAKSGWDIHEIATFAGHRSVESTLQYIHLSGGELASKLERGMNSLHAWRVKMMAEEFK
jgi:site-specific recombinase XerD